MSHIRALLFRLRAAIVLVAVTAVFGGALFSTPTARADSASPGFTVPCDRHPVVSHHPGTTGKAETPLKREGAPGHCPDCCLFGVEVFLALPARGSFMVQPSTESKALAFYFISGAGAGEQLFSGAANGARAPPVAS